MHQLRFAVVLSVLVLPAISQRRPLTHDDYDRWPSIHGAAFSSDGKWMAYAVDPAWGDGMLHVREVDGERHYTHARGSAPRFSIDGARVVFTIKDSVVEERREKLEKLRSGEKPAAASGARTPARRGGRRGAANRPTSSGVLAVLAVDSGDVEELGKVKSWQMTKRGAFLVYQPDDARPETEDEDKDKDEPAATAKPAAKERPKRDAAKKGSLLVLRNLTAGATSRFADVVTSQFVADDAWLCLSVAARKEDAKIEAPTVEATTLAAGLHAIELASGKRAALVDGAASYIAFTTDKRHRRLAFVSDVAERKARGDDAEEEPEAENESKGGEAADADSKKAPPRYELFAWTIGADTAQRVVAEDTPGMPADCRIDASGLSFSDDGSVLTFGIKDAPPPELPKILPEEKVVVDVWHWRDPMLQPTQAKQVERLRNPVRTCVLRGDRVVPLGDRDLPQVRLLTPDGSLALANDDRPYQILTTWDGRYRDVYLVDTTDGSRRLLLERQRGAVESSPAGRWILYFGDDMQWHAIDAAGGEHTCLTADLGVHFDNELEDRPQPANAYGVAGWTAGDREVLLYDRWDIWKIDPASGVALCVTDGFGRSHGVVLRVERFDFEGDDDDLDPLERDYLPAKLLLAARDDRSKARGYYVDFTTGVHKPRQLVMRDAMLGQLTRARDAERLFFTVSSFAESPDLWTADLAFGGMRKLTDACPMQRQVRWGNAELVTWVNADGRDLQGYLIKPDGFDPQRRYPMMVYFYERNADNLHRYVAPAPGTSPNAAYYVSQGYLWFVPDIVYEVGYPGESAEKCVLSGVQHLIAQGFVDREAIGCAGHSWGGYQTAHLITRTDLFAAAESGAPVSNMFSAYGGLRYGSGVSRQFQYERTQSRIGGTPWDYPQRYWQNSPVFYADRVATPCLILHNDNDGAVPWTNGIEFFMALRRLGKEAYLFNYNGEDHGLRQRQNQKDWARRMAAFFDHHLRGAPAPDWMLHGVPFIDREREKIRFAPSYIEASAMGTIDPQAKQAVEAPSGGVR